MKTNICVHYRDGQWNTMVDGRPGAGFLYQVDAVEAALQLAEQVRAKGGEATLTLWDRTGEVRTLDEPTSSLGRSQPSKRASSIAQRAHL